MAVASAYILAELLSENRDLRETLAVYERTLKPTIRRQQAAARRIARWLVPTSTSGVWIRNLVTRASTWPPVATALQRRMAAASVFRHSPIPPARQNETSRIEADMKKRASFLRCSEGIAGPTLHGS
jgi:hypothetical protein